jgi:chromate reductase, NAD(P)H dehydrogenase (quinone)
MTNVAVICGSSRATGSTRKLAGVLARVAPAELELRELAIADLPLYHEDLELPEPPARWARFRAELRACDAVLFVTPEYNRSMPAALKNAVDIGSSPDDCSVWAGKPAAIASHSPGMLGGFGANHHLRQALVFLDMPVLQQPELYLCRSDEQFDDRGELRDERVRELLARFMEAFLQWTRRF